MTVRRNEWGISCKDLTAGELKESCKCLLDRTVDKKKSKTGEEIYFEMEVDDP